jgi:4-hydroxyphenylpyruvate dioxygenase
MESKPAPPSFGKILGFGTNILKLDHIVFWVGNAKQAASYYTSRFGFDFLAYKGLETGDRSVVSHALRNHEGTTFVFCSVYNKDSSEQMNQHLIQHGDGVKDIALTVEDTRAIYEYAIKNGGVSIRAPYELSDEHGFVVLASIRTYGDTIHTFVERKNYKGAFLPGYHPHHLTENFNKVMAPIRFKKVDHIVGNQPDLQM